MNEYRTDNHPDNCECDSCYSRQVIARELAWEAAFYGGRGFKAEAYCNDAEALQGRQTANGVMERGGMVDRELEAGNLAIAIHRAAEIAYAAFKHLNKTPDELAARRAAWAGRYDGDY